MSKMFNYDLKEIIKELADELSFIPDEQLADVIADMIDNLLPFAIMVMPDELTKVNDKWLTEEEYHERRTWGKDRGTLETKIEQRRQVLEHVMASKTAILPKEIGHGSLMMVVQQKAQTSMEMMKPPLRNIEGEQAIEEYTSHSFKHISKSSRHRTAVLNYTIDDSLVEKMTKDILFVKFCSAIERTIRNFVMTQIKQTIFELKGSADVEFPEWNRTVLFIQFPETSFSDKLWSILSTETRNELNKVSNHLSNDEQIRFRDYITNFSVQMVL